MDACETVRPAVTRSALCKVAQSFVRFPGCKIQYVKPWLPAVGGCFRIIDFHDNGDRIAEGSEWLVNVTEPWTLGQVTFEVRLRQAESILTIRQREHSPRRPNNRLPALLRQSHFEHQIIFQ
jgi:hypothetical protein